MSNAIIGKVKEIHNYVVFDFNYHKLGAYGITEDIIRNAAKEQQNDLLPIIEEQEFAVPKIIGYTTFIRVENSKIIIDGVAWNEIKGHLEITGCLIKIVKGNVKSIRIDEINVVENKE